MKQAHVSLEEAEKRLHAVTYRLKVFREACGLDISHDLKDKRPTKSEFWTLVFMTVSIEFAAVFYFLSASLGFGDSFYTAVTTIALIIISALGAALGHALAMRPPVSLFHWRRVSGAILLIMASAFFCAALGILSHTRADSTVSGFLAVIVAGYLAWVNLEVLVSGVVNILCFGVLVYEFRFFLFSKYWGYRHIKETYDEAKQTYEQAKQAGSN